MKFLITGFLLILFGLSALIFAVLLVARWKKNSLPIKLFFIISSLLSGFLCLISLSLLVYFTVSSAVPAKSGTSTSDDSDYLPTFTGDSRTAGKTPERKSEAARTIEKPAETKHVAAKIPAEDPAKLAKKRFEQAVEMSKTALETNDRDLYLKSISYAESAAVIEPSNARYSILAGKLYSQIGNDYDSQLAAEGYLLKALEADPGNIQASLLLSDCYFRQERFASAAELLEKILQSNPALANNPPVIKSLSMCYLLDSQAEKGCASLQRILKNSPDNETARISLATLKFKMGKKDEAEAELRKVISAGGLNKNYAASLLEKGM
ncbi:MAG TPA: hypothetical protein DCZ94_11400 [Lentisphaeria bacterium]|nr:MAG: hypothetical protein A2X48_17490 [Lentisphaerae bacterium GWF2_49_21]HBC87552.1 hypothetical protein [Lentisphaeria bacterium]